MHFAAAHFESTSTVVQAHGFRLRPPIVDAVPVDADRLRYTFEDQVHLLGYGSPAERVLSGGVLPLSLYWSAPAELDRRYRIALALTDADGFSWAKLDYEPVRGKYPLSEWPTGKIVRDDVDLDLAPGVPPGDYMLTVSLYPDDGSGPALAVRDLDNGDLLGLVVPVRSVTVLPAQRQPDRDDLPVEYPLSRQYGPLTLVGHDYDGGTYRPGDVISADAYWWARRTPRSDLSFELQLCTETGQVVAVRPVAPSNRYPADQWQGGEVVWGRYRFRIPVDISPGRYSLALAPTGQVWPWQRRSIALNEVNVLPLEAGRSFEVPPMERVVGANLGDRVELLGYDLEAESVRAGGVVSCTLYWRGLDAMAQNYTVFTHLVAADGTTWGQWDNQPERGTMPTTRWLPGQVIVDPYEIPVSPDAPAGPLELRVGMYNLRSMTRLPVYGPEGQITGNYVTLTEILVVEP
jgi:hypothetical protein